MRASIAQVARHANVSAMTVSRVARGRKNQVSAETYERVLAAMQELNYVPMRSSFQNRHVQTSTIGYVPHDLDVPHNLIDSVTLEGMCKAARRRGYDMLLMLRDEADWVANRQNVRFLDRRSDGFVILSPRQGEWPDLFETLVEQEVPVVVCYRRDVPDAMAWVDPDNREIMRLAVQHLAAHGHKRLAMLVSPAANKKQEAIEIVALGSAAELHDHFDDIERERFFHQFVAQFCGTGASSHVVRALDHNWNLFPNAAPWLLEHDITGVICGDNAAMQLWNNAEKFGLAVPDDLSVVGVDNIAQAAQRGLTSVAFGYDEVGRLAVEAWVELQSGLDPASCCKVVPVTLIERASVARPHKD